VKKTTGHFDRSDAEHHEAEKSIKKQISRLAFGSLSTGHLTVEMTSYGVFYKA